MSLLDSVRRLIAEKARNRSEFHSSDLFTWAYQSKESLPGLDFKYGSDFPYSERLEDIIYLLLMSGDLQISPRDSRKLVLSERLRAKREGRAAGAAAE